MISEVERSRDLEELLFGEEPLARRVNILVIELGELSRKATNAENMSKVGKGLEANALAADAVNEASDLLAQLDLFRLKMFEWYPNMKYRPSFEELHLNGLERQQERMADLRTRMGRD